MTTQHKLRGADIVARTLDRLGVDRIFSVSGNHIMPVFDALLDTRIEIIHARHEAACVHMADAYARFSGKPGIALVTGGQAHVNATAGLVTAAASASPVILLSGSASLLEAGRGAFQELPQAEIAAPLAKHSWTASAAADLGHDIARAMRFALGGRPGPVHLGLPVDLLEQELSDCAIEKALPEQGDARPVPEILSMAAMQEISRYLSSAKKPLVLHGPQLCSHRFRHQLRQLEARLQVPVIGMESPRGVRDPSLGAFAELLAEADLLLLIDKELDFTLSFGESPAIRNDCRIVRVAPVSSRVANSGRIAAQYQADALSVLQGLTKTPLHAPLLREAAQEWLDYAKTALNARPANWETLAKQHRALDRETVHPVDVCNAVARFFLRNPTATLVSDGGEFGQWAQAIVKPDRRLINGTSGTIGAAVPFAMAAQLADREAPVVVMTGDGSFGFHMAEIDTAVRYGLPIVIIIGNDARWNAEYQIQLRSYGSSRTHACELLPTRYDKVVEALGGYGEAVTHADQFDAAIARAVASGKPACLNVFIEPAPAPVIRRQQSS